MEVFITPLLEARIVASIVLVACFFDCAMEVYRIFIKEIGGCKVRATAEPPSVAVAFSVHCFKVAIIEVHGRCVGILRVQDTTETCRKELETFDVGVQGLVIHAHFLDGGTREGAIDGAYIDPCFLKDGAILKHARYPTATIRPCPGVCTKFLAGRVQSLES